MSYKHIFLIFWFLVCTYNITCKITNATLIQICKIQLLALAIKSQSFKISDDGRQTTSINTFSIWVCCGSVKLDRGCNVCMYNRNVSLDEPIL
jgi:hypothetical protein